MHIKAIPAAVGDAVKAAGVHPVVLAAGVGVVGLGGYYVYSRRAASAAASAPNGVLRGDPTSLGGIATSGAIGAAGGDISGIVANSLGGGAPGATTPVVSGGVITNVPTSSGAPSLLTTTPAINAPTGLTTTPGVTNTPTVTPGTGVVTPPAGLVPGSPDSATQQLLDQQLLSLNYNYTYQMSQLQLTAAISATNAWLEGQALSASNFAVAAGIAESFINSPDQASMGIIRGADGNPIIDFSMINAQNSNKNGFDSNLATLINTGTFANFWNQTATQGPTAAPANTSNVMPNYFAAFLAGPNGVPGYVSAPAPAAGVNNTNPIQPASTAPPVAATPVAAISSSVSNTVPSSVDFHPSNVNIPTIQAPTVVPQFSIAPSAFVPVSASGGVGGGGGRLESFNLQAA